MDTLKKVVGKGEKGTEPGQATNIGGVAGPGQQGQDLGDKGTSSSHNSNSSFLFFFPPTLSPFPCPLYSWTEINTLPYLALPGLPANSILFVAYRTGAEYLNKKYAGDKLSAQQRENMTDTAREGFENAMGYVQVQVHISHPTFQSHIQHFLFLHTCLYKARC